MVDRLVADDAVQKDLFKKMFSNMSLKDNNEGSAQTKKSTAEEEN